MEITKLKENKSIYKCLAKQATGGKTNSFRVVVRDYSPDEGTTRREIDLFIDDKNFMLDIKALKTAADFLREVHEDLVKPPPETRSGDPF